MIAVLRCSRCGGENAPRGFCADCLLSAALDDIEPPELGGTLIGPYRLGGLLGAGGVGLVYEAVDVRPRAIRPGQKVALKILAAGVDAPDQLVREAQLAAALEHEHILPVYEVGEHDGISYFTMKRVEGGPLKTPAASSREAAEVTLKIAKAVRFAHRHGILHRDLKPANVLVDEDGRPFVTDFGLAEREETADGKVRAGTPEYMAPETWDAKPASTVVDVWGVGTILYQLLAGRPPFEAPSLQELQRKICGEAPPPLVGIPADLAAICQRCLQREPAYRYVSAHELALDLERFLANEPVHARPLGFFARGWRRVTRHPVMAVLSVLLLSVAIGLCFALLSGMRAQRAATIAELERTRAQQTAFRTAEYAAKYAADDVARQFRRHSDVVEAAGRDARVARAIADQVQAQAMCDALLAEHKAETFNAWYLFDATGVMWGRAPLTPNDNRGRSYAWRDYFVGAEKLGRSVVSRPYVSSVFRSESDDLYEIAISFPVHDEARRFVGVLVTAIRTGAALGPIRLKDSPDQRLTLALLAPRDRDRERRPDEARPDRIMILHPSLADGTVRPERDAELLPDLGFGFTYTTPVADTPFFLRVQVADENTRPSH